MTSGKSDITISVDDTVSKKLGQYWGALAKEGVIGVEPDFTDSWYAALNKGKYATWLTGAWGPGLPVRLRRGHRGQVARGPAAAVGLASPARDSAARPPRSSAPPRTPSDAAVFAQFLNSDPASARRFTTEQFFFPATKTLLAEASFLGDTPAFYGGQKVNQVFADISTQVNPAFQWPPFLDRVATDWTC